MGKFVLALVLSLSIFSFFSSSALAAGGSQEKQTGTILEKSAYACADAPEVTCYTFQLQIDEQVVTVNVDSTHNAGSFYDVLRVGDEVFAQQYTFASETGYAILGPVRSESVLLLVVLFIILAIVVGKWQGVGSILGLTFSILVIFVLVIPLIINGWNAVLVGFLGAIATLIVSIYFSHGFNAKSTIALVSTIIGLGLVALLALVFMNLTKLTGLGDENVIFLIQELGSGIDFRGVLFASILIAGIGILDDLTVNQVAAMIQIFKANPKLTSSQLFNQGMTLGREHIASMVNTLFIAYASASMPLVMLWQIRSTSLVDILNSNVFVEEIVRTVVGSMGLVLVVPITAYLAAGLITRNPHKWLSMSDEHLHVH